MKTVKRKRIKENVISNHPVEGLLFIVLLKDGKEGFLRNLHGSDLFHTLLTGLLFFQKFAFTRNVTAVALGQNVLTKRLDVFSATSFAPMAA